MEPWEILESRYVLKRDWMSVREDRVRLPSGLEVNEFHVVEYPNWVCILCLDTDGRVVLVEQYRHGIGRSSVELPAGAAKKKEEPLEAAKRELREETGYVAEEWHVLGRCAPNPGKQTSFAHLFVARGARQAGEQRLDPTEAIRIRLVAPAEVLGMADRGIIEHGIHLATLFWAARRGFIDAEGSSAESIGGLQHGID